MEDPISLEQERQELLERLPDDLHNLVEQTSADQRRSLLLRIKEVHQQQIEHLEYQMIVLDVLADLSVERDEVSESTMQIQKPNIEAA